MNINFLFFNDSSAKSRSRHPATTTCNTFQPKPVDITDGTIVAEEIKVVGLVCLNAIALLYVFNEPQEMVLHYWITLPNIEE